MNWKQLLAMRLKAMRAARGWTLREMAEVTGVSHGIINRLENGIGHCYFDTLAKIALGFGCTVEDLSPTEEHRK